MFNKIFRRGRKDAGAKKGAVAAAGGKTAAEKLRQQAEDFVTRNTIEIIDAGGNRVRISPIKWLYPGYGEYREHAIVPDNERHIATEIIHEKKFVNDFLSNNGDTNGLFGYFVARVEGNYVQMSLHGSKLFTGVRESDVDDYDTLVLIKQANRLFPKFNSETFAIDFKHIEVFGEIFNKLKARLSGNADNLPPEQAKLLSIDIPTYTQSSIKIESSIDSYYILKLAEVLERLAQDVTSVSEKQGRTTVSAALERIDRVKDILYGSERSERFFRGIENLEKISEQLSELKRSYNEFAAAIGQ